MITGGYEYGCLAQIFGKGTSAQELVDAGVPASTAMMHAIQDCGGDNSPGELAGVPTYCEGCTARIVVKVSEAIQELTSRVSQRLDLEKIVD